MNTALAQVVGAGVLLLLARVVVAVLAAEARGMLPLLSRFLIKRACRRLPVDERSRWEAEWIADLSSFSDRPLGGLVHALQTSRSARAVAYELPRGDASLALP